MELIAAVRLVLTTAQLSLVILSLTRVEKTAPLVGELEIKRGMVAEMTPRRLILLGPPAAGKGTHAERLAGEMGVPHVSTGDMLRHEVEEGSRLGARTKALMAHGELVPDDVVVQLAVKRLRRSDAAHGWILDGFPRNLRQAQGLDEYFERPELVIALDVSTLESLDRITGRRMCPQGHVYHLRQNPPRHSGICDEDGAKLFQREDDREDVVQHRLDVYAQETQPLLEMYEKRGVLRRVDSTGRPQDVYRRVAAVLER